MVKHWALVDLERMLIEFTQYPKGHVLVKALPHRPRWAQRLLCERLFPGARLEFWFGNWYGVWRDKLGRFVKRPEVCPRVRLYRVPLMWRHCLSISYVVGHDYRNVAVYHFSLRPELDLAVKNEMLDMLIAEIERDIGYVESDFWFETEPNVGLDRVSYVEGETEHCFLTEVYKSKDLEEMAVFRVAFAERMIKEKQWFKPETLERWLPFVEA